MKSFWLICLIGGVLAFVAASLFFALFGNRGARIFYRLLGLGLVVLGLYLGKANQWSLTEPPPYEIVVSGTWPGDHDARQTSAALTALASEFDRIAGVMQVVSETRPEGSYRCSVAFHRKFNLEGAKRSVDAAMNVAKLYIPSDLRPLRRGNPTPVRESDQVSLAIIRKSMNGDESPLWELARAVAKRLVEEHALFALDPLDDQIPSGGAPPVLVVRVERWPAVRITGSRPADTWMRNASARCLELAEMERVKRPDAEDFETEILGTGQDMVPPLRDWAGHRY